MKLNRRLSFFVPSAKMRIVLPESGAVIRSGETFAIKVVGIDDDSKTITVTIVQNSGSLIVTLPVVDGEAEGTAKIFFPGGTTFYVENNVEIPVGNESTGNVNAESDTHLANNRVLFRGVGTFDFGTATADIARFGLVDAFDFGTATVDIARFGLVDAFDFGTATVTIERL